MFILHTPKSNTPTPIVIKKMLPDGQLKLSLGIKILPGHWQKDKERAAIKDLDRATISENKSINTLLEKIEQYINSRSVDARYTGNHLTCAELTEKLQELTGRKKQVRGPNIYGQCEAIIDDMKLGLILTSGGKVYSKGTLKNYNTYIQNFKEYNPALTWNDITLNFYRAFIRWCNDKDFSINYIGQHVNKLIVLLKEAKGRGYHNNTIYLDGEFKRLSENTEDISLTPAELDNIYKHTFPSNVLDVCRDWFIIDCYLGLRISDIQLLDTKNIEKDRVTIVSEKTDTKVVIPLRPEVREILKKWNGLPPRMSDRDINRNIKKVCKEVGFTDTVLYFITKGGARKDYYLKKYEMVSCHTARRSFITNLLNAGIPDNQVMQLAGLKKHATLLRYKKTKPEETADLLKGHQFFK